ncbi:hypothetical protein ABIB50_003559 [Mucilaginibacter sp. UYCu711]
MNLLKNIGGVYTKIINKKGLILKSSPFAFINSDGFKPIAIVISNDNTPV